jgi:SAM-dependent methyltransferase
MNKIHFLSLGRQPMANKYPSKKDEDQRFYNLDVCFDTQNYMVSLEKFISSEDMFTDEYAYYSSTSSTMINHFREASEFFKDSFKTKKVLEIGSNDGIFSKNFSNNTAVCIEPCGNLAKITESMGYKTYNLYWNPNSSRVVVENEGKFDLIYSANCISHIPILSDAIVASYDALNDDGVFIFEDPSLLEMFKRVSYDQIYDEHSYMFSALSIDIFLKNYGFEIFKIEKTSVHGGGNRIYAKKLNSNRPICKSVLKALEEELDFGLADADTYFRFGDRVRASRDDLLKKVSTLKNQGKKIISYGATAKSVTVFNYCGINNDHIDYVVDVTEFKQGKYLPGVNIPVVKYDNLNDDVDVAFLGAWNFADEILKKESSFLSRGGKFLTHIKSIENNLGLFP